MKQPPDTSHKEYLMEILTRDQEYALELYKNIIESSAKHEMLILMTILNDAGITNIVTNRNGPKSGSEK